ncbi:uncharacterized protein LOC130731953 [Lotus japonicus]|uniref:uncharacterized protein LOC130731953 n=1 Tax=Lotus japonicus TaxID=34305 RepID=UPI00258E6B7B|nr:uncharacterized protein LOC130731953 [Lotus japonicus]
MEQDPNPFVRHCKRQSNNSGSSRPLILGPVGAIQAAMYARRSTPNTPLIPTQEIVRRVLDHGSIETDPDFNSHAWLSALQEWGNATPLGSLTTNVERVENVVAVIKPCTPNGFGDAKVTLKDPTGAVDASIHRKAFTHSEFANDITIGSVLVLQKVAVFAPRGTVCYLNITLPNLVKVFPKDCGPHDFIDITEE